MSQHGAFYAELAILAERARRRLLPIFVGSFRTKAAGRVRRLPTRFRHSEVANWQKSDN